MPITAIYASLFALLMVHLAMRVIQARRSALVSRGDGGDRHLTLQRSLFSNTLDYGLIVLVLMALAESLQAPGFLLHAAGMLFAAGRWFYLSNAPKEPKTFTGRIRGMKLTFFALIALSILNLILAFMPGFVCCQLPI